MTSQIWVRLSIVLNWKYDIDVYEFTNVLMFKTYEVKHWVSFIVKATGVKCNHINFSLCTVYIYVFIWHLYERLNQKHISSETRSQSYIEISNCISVLNLNKAHVNTACRFSLLDASVWLNASIVLRNYLFGYESLVEGNNIFLSL